MLVIGIDENGLGPVLGPLVVTAVAFEAEAYTPGLFWEAAGAGLAADDSKRLFSAAKMAAAEAATLAWLKAFGIAPRTYTALADEIVLSPPFQRRCYMVPAYCSPSCTRLPAWASATDAALPGADRALAERGIAPVSVRAFSLCPGIFNAVTSEQDVNKLALDCRLMLELVRRLASGYEGQVLALCGKVGSARKYGPWLAAAGVPLWMAEAETPEISTYRIIPYGRVSFIRDGDALHLPISVASMVGKYLRELAMRDVNSLLERPGVRPASGYRDQITARFIEETGADRERLGIHPLCFLRNS